MRVIWCRDLSDLANIARAHGWVFHLAHGGKHYFYLYVGTEEELICIAVQTEQPVTARYLSIDEDGKLSSSDKPILPTCARVTDVTKDETFESFI
jgi:hypothetical protein